MKDSAPVSDESRCVQLRDRLRGLFVLLLGIGVALGTIVWSKEMVKRRNPEGATIGSLRGIAGYPDRVDVVATLPAARGHSDISELRGITAEGVGPDGTIDLTKSDYNTKYVFAAGPGSQETKAGKGSTARPERDGGRVCARQSVKLRRRGLRLEENRPDARCQPDAGRPLPRPVCGPKEVWQRAIKKGAPKDAVARLDYYWANAGPAWKLTVAKKRFSIAVTHDCSRELTADESKGRTP